MKAIKKKIASVREYFEGIDRAKSSLLTSEDSWEAVGVDDVHHVACLFDPDGDRFPSMPCFSSGSIVSSGRSTGAPTTSTFAH